MTTMKRELIVKTTQKQEILSYKFVRLLGKGNFGQVYQAENKNNGKTVAIKKVKIKPN